MADTDRWQDWIVIDPAILAGKPIIKGTRIAVEFIVELLAEGWSKEEILQNYPQVSPEAYLAALRWVSEVLRSERVYPMASDRP